MERRINRIPLDMTWEDFLKKFGKFFPISKESERIAKLKSEYERLTGRKPEEASGKLKRTQQTVGKANASSNGGKGSSTDKGSRKDSYKSQHGPALSGKGLFGEKPS